MCRCECTTMCLWMSENKFVELILYFCHVGSRDQSKSMRPGEKCLHPLSHEPVLTFKYYVCQISELGVRKYNTHWPCSQTHARTGSVLPHYGDSSQPQLGSKCGYLISSSYRVRGRYKCRCFSQHSST